MNWRVTLSDLRLDRESKAVQEVLACGWLTMGEQTRRFEAAFAEYCGAKHAVAVANGTAALHLAYLAVGVTPGDEVICPALTFVATASAALYCGATPVFADITSDHDLTISPRSVAGLLSERTRCIAVMHYAGFPADMAGIRAVAAAHDVAVVEDACHAVGAEYEGKRCGTLGDIACFSFFSNKNLAIGEGGMVTTDDDLLASRLRRLRSHGMSSVTWDRHRGHAFSYDVQEVGYNYRIDEIRAAMGLAQLDLLDVRNRRRLELAGQYRRRLDAVAGIRVPFRHHGQKSAHHIQPVLLPPDCDRQQVMLALRERGIQSSIHYPPVHRFSAFAATAAADRTHLPVTESVAARELTLPLHPFMSADDVDFVCDAVAEVLS